MKRTLATVFLCLMLATPAGAGFDEGLAAYKRGDYATALREFRPLAEQGNAKAQVLLGAMFHAGEGVSQDHATAVKWYRKAAEQGSAFAQNNLGVMYEKGQGVVRDYAEAVKWYRLAAMQGEPGAQLMLGLSYYSARGIPQDNEQAHLWFILAAMQGHQGARDIVAKKMTSTQIAEAQRMARDWMAVFNKRRGK